jgi:glycosyltransferase involved in cell wall biosynthesis
MDLGRGWRGGQQQVVTLVKGLVQAGHEVTLLARRGSPLERKARTAQISVKGVRPGWATWRAALALRRSLGEGFDLVHIHDGRSHTAAWLVGRPHQVPRIVSRRVCYALPQGFLTRLKYRNGAERYVAVSDWVRRQLLAGGIPAEKIEVIHDGVELPMETTDGLRASARRALGVPEDSFVVSCIGHLYRDKGQHHLVEAAREIAKRRRLVMLLAGSGPLAHYLERQVRRLGLGRVVRLLGQVPDLSFVYQASDVFAFPARNEGLGTAMLLAMAYGVPVVAPDHEANPEVIRDGVDGLLVADRSPREPDAGELARGIERLAEDVALRTRLGKEARRTIEARFTSAIMLRRTAAFYAAVAYAE